MPVHQYAYHAAGDDDALKAGLARACRAYTRVVLRLRAQAEAEARFAPPPPANPARALSPGSTRRPSRAPSPASSFHGGASLSGTSGAGASAGFRSPLFSTRRAPLLQVFVPSPEGDWLSDDSVLMCEGELRRAGVIHLMRVGDVVWDVAVGDEGNMGRMVWDGGYLLDLDYSWSRIGDIPPYLPALAFPPSYFHRVVRTAGSGNPIVHIDISPWGGEIAANLQLLQGRTKTETPQGNFHTVVGWVHRSSFTIHATPMRINVPPGTGPGPGAGGAWLVDPGWHGTVVVEAEGTNEGKADLQARCGRAFPQRVPSARERAASVEGDKGVEKPSLVFRILREKSRPGEIWIRTVRDKERLNLPGA
ncbi:hypothetical protein WOLCODRAFT_83453 [Wolfiporia cocos MD-104 SS10]|uniref:Uncharacterized protein n=1 Tax=Wolfiporia cocos (strain MD-104) TaxID=742152 RepID=A0A2H3J4Q5_WOLCO|nr:hypothetical protein WOLCODRAFT_83453 [Wolfiporia cocos MD-104 SS10]